MANNTGHSNVTRITEGDDLADECGGSAITSGVGGLLVAKGGSCDLDTCTGVILGSNCSGGIVLRAISSALGTIVDICEPPGRMRGCTGQARHNSGRRPQRVWRPPRCVGPRPLRHAGRQPLWHWWHTWREGQ
jgi:hypothetical protein